MSTKNTILKAYDGRFLQIFQARSSTYWLRRHLHAFAQRSEDAVANQCCCYVSVLCGV